MSDEIKDIYVKVLKYDWKIKQLGGSYNIYELFMWHPNIKMCMNQRVKYIRQQVRGKNRYKSCIYKLFPVELLFPKG